MKRHIYLLVMPLLLMGSCKELSDPEYSRLKNNIQATVNWNYNWSGSYIDLDAAITNYNTQPVNNISLEFSFYDYSDQLITTRNYNYRGTLAAGERINFSGTYAVENATRVRQRISYFGY